MKKNNETKNDFSRRDFVKTATVGIGSIGAAALAGMGATPAEAAEVPKRWDKVADVVVVGGPPGFRPRRDAALSKTKTWTGSPFLIDQSALRMYRR